MHSPRVQEVERIHEGERHGLLPEQPLKLLRPTDRVRSLLNVHQLEVPDELRIVERVLEAQIGEVVVGSFAESSNSFRIGERAGSSYALVKLGK